mgnify:CR=1 FL=1
MLTTVMDGDNSYVNNEYKPYTARAVNIYLVAVHSQHDVGRNQAVM